MYKLILIDFYMPEMNGDECIKRIVDIFKEVKTVQRPYICCISGGGDEVEDRMNEAGCDEIQMPPLSKEELRS